MNTPNENRWYIWLSIILVIIVTFPYLLGFAIQTDELKFSGFVYWCGRPEFIFGKNEGPGMRENG